MSGTKRSGTNAVAISKKKIKTVDVCGYMDCSVDVSCYLLDFLISLFVVDFVVVVVFLFVVLSVSSESLCLSTLMKTVETV